MNKNAPTPKAANPFWKREKGVREGGNGLTMKLEESPALLNERSPWGMRMFVLERVIDWGATVINAIATKI